MAKKIFSKSFQSLLKLFLSRSYWHWCDREEFFDCEILATLSRLISFTTSVCRPDNTNVDGAGKTTAAEWTNGNWPWPPVGLGSTYLIVRTFSGADDAAIFIRRNPSQDRTGRLVSSFEDCQNPDIFHAARILKNSPLIRMRTMYVCHNNFVVTLRY